MLTLREVWNQAVSRAHNEKEFKPRDYIYASELGGSVYDLWQKLQGIPPTNPPNDRAFRKFNAGHFWEWVVQMTLYNAGVLESCQKHVVREPNKDTLGIHGRLDFIVSPNGKEEMNMEDLRLPEFLLDITKQFKVMRDFEPQILEIKSISSMLFPKRESAPADNHLLQTQFYCRELDMNGLICYISKDDCMLAEHFVDKGSILTGTKIDVFVDKVSGFYFNNERPPLEPLILKEGGKFSKNWAVEYSAYLDHYGFKTPEEYRESVDSNIGRWNRILKRIEEGKKMTDDNKRGIEEMINFC